MALDGRKLVIWYFRGGYTTGVQSGGTECDQFRQRMLCRPGTCRPYPSSRCHSQATHAPELHRYEWKRLVVLSFVLLEFLNRRALGCFVVALNHSCTMSKCCSAPRCRVLCQRVSLTASYWDCGRTWESAMIGRHNIRRITRYCAGKFSVASV